LKENTPLAVKALLEEAKASEHKEAYKALDRNPNYRIGIGVRLTSPSSPSFFVEILIYLCPNLTEANLMILEKSLTCLKELQARKYVLTCQDGNCISCETAMPIQNIAKEYATVKSLMETHLGS
jgi:hypothetical protein